MKVKRPRGTRDFTPEEMRVRNAILEEITDVFETYGYEPVLTPTFEHAELFELKSGEEILKEMYVFKDKKGRKLALRPEMTAPVVRFYNQELKTRPHPLKLYYFVNCFRYARPQRGRWREFWQAGVELIGAKGILADAEVVEMTHTIFERLLPGNSFRTIVGHLGVLRGILEAHGLDENVQNRVAHLVDKGDLESVERELPDDTARDVLTVVKADDPGEIEDTVRGTPAEDALNELLELSDTLRSAGVPHRVDTSVARGLDYYTGMVFEVHVPELGPSSQCAGGGRYDTLVKDLGGPDVPAVGMAIGFDRLVLAVEKLSEPPVKEERTRALLIPLTDDPAVIELARTLRENLGWIVDVEVSGKSLSKALATADSKGYDAAVIVGERELESDAITVKNLKTGEQVEAPIKDLEKGKDPLVDADG